MPEANLIIASLALQSAELALAARCLALYAAYRVKGGAEPIVAGLPGDTLARQIFNAIGE